MGRVAVSARVGSISPFATALCDTRVARFGHAGADEHSEGAVWVWNLTDDEAQIFREQIAILGQDRVVCGEPRTYGVEFAARF